MSRKPRSVLEIVKAHLEDHGYAGLFSDNECACEIADLAPCSEMNGDCRAGYRTECDCGDHDFHISESREATP